MERLKSLTRCKAEKNFNIEFDTDNKNDNTIEISNKEFNEIMVLLQTLEIQNKKISTCQDQSFQWCVKHNQNLNKIYKSINKLSVIINSNNSNNGGNSFYQQNDQMQCDILNNCEKDFHQKILECYDPLEPFSEILQYLIMQIDKNSFCELKEIIFPVILKWLTEDSSSSSMISISIVILWETHSKFPSMFFNPKYKDIYKKFYTNLINLESKGTIQYLINENIFPFNNDEFITLKRLLSSLS
ncbi:hypothetical protein CYY_006869 [Polysphondylium violaceum]|uniref:Uncharacterized protein n=1 Tax=Polysphondylium violaceum TaxID=133409 RepID=A0A8J4PPY1_9MYCE|nr:hypothetical protein CYY_006869 [Polysphondylium violaceum]